MNYTVILPLVSPKSVNNWKLSKCLKKKISTLVARGLCTPLLSIRVCRLRSTAACMEYIAFGRRKWSSKKMGHLDETSFVVISTVSKHLFNYTCTILLFFYAFRTIKISRQYYYVFTFRAFFRKFLISIYISYRSIFHFIYISNKKYTTHNVPTIEILIVCRIVSRNL